MANARITKKQHTRLLGDFLIECTQDSAWEGKLKALSDENKIDTSVDGFPAAFLADFPEAEYQKLHYCIERVEYAEVPRAASCWWPVDAETQYFMAYPADFPQSQVYMAIDFDECDHDHDHDH
ncbi:hypothetical protein [Oceanobacter mangrovi]|uniref:hypothetical protein n=1 Tax=Oceanobacter mangrovi TaxID=2862510 RepID=UPI001C8E6F6D|nr:hypothetical protein [Oceanobacter mangrovi]